MNIRFGLTALMLSAAVPAGALLVATPGAPVVPLLLVVPLSALCGVRRSQPDRIVSVDSTNSPISAGRLVLVNREFMGCDSFWLARVGSRLQRGCEKALQAG